MSLLKKENWVVCLLLTLLTQGAFFFVLAYFMKLYRKDKWYADPKYWVISILFLFFPVFILLTVFTVQMLVEIASHLEVPGKEIYATPYSWILCIIVPIIGWVLLIVMLIYISIWIIVALAQGKGEQYIK